MLIGRPSHPTVVRIRIEQGALLLVAGATGVVPHGIDAAVRRHGHGPEPLICVVPGIVVDAHGRAPGLSTIGTADEHDVHGIVRGLDRAEDVDPTRPGRIHGDPWLSEQTVDVRDAKGLAPAKVDLNRRERWSLCRNLGIGRARNEERGQVQPASDHVQRAVRADIHRSVERRRWDRCGTLEAQPAVDRA